MSPRPDIPTAMADALGAYVITHQKIELYIPNKDRDGNLVANLDDWVAAAKTCLTNICGGASVLRGVEGEWLNKDTGKILSENTTIVYSFVLDLGEFYAKRSILKGFISEFGNNTNQKEVLIVLNGDALMIDKF